MIGLIYLPCVLGMTAESFIMGLVNDRLALWLALRKHGSEEPEARL